MTVTQQAIGPILDELGVTISMGPNDRVTEVLIVAKTTDLDDGQVALVISSNDLDWVAKWGLHAAAGHVFADPGPLMHRDEDDDDD